MFDKVTYLSLPVGDGERKQTPFREETSSQEGKTKIRTS